MAFQTPPTTLVNIQAIAQDDAGIQAATDTDTDVVLIIEDVARYVTVAIFGDDTEAAQRYAAAHFLSIARQPVGGRGPLSSYSVGGISRTFTLPYINQKTVFGATQFGLMYLEFLNRNVVPYANIITGPVVAS